MIGDREHDADEAATDDLPPVDACLLFNPPAQPDGLRLPPAWVERRGMWVVIRHCFPEGDATTETPHPTTASALRGYARQVAYLEARGYVNATAGW